MMHGIALIRNGGWQQSPGRKTRVTLPAQNNETVVIPIHSPGSGSHFPEIDKFPVAGVDVAQAQVVAYCRRHIKPGALVQIRSRAFVAKNILPVISGEWSAVFPLGVANAVIMADRDPTTFEH